VPHRDVNAALTQVLNEIEPDWVFIPFGGDIHLDHQMVFLSSLVAARPNRARAPSRIYAYETLSETNWHAPFVCPQFVPSVFVDISDHIERKLEALRMFRLELKEFPHERSLKAVRALSTLRGATVNRKSAEAFMLVRMVV
jgi:LmbE family N-acetylglucosaminyl deacetylase